MAVAYHPLPLSTHGIACSSLKETKESLDNNTPTYNSLLTQCHSWRRTKLLMKQIITNSSARLYLDARAIYRVGQKSDTSRTM